MSVGAYERIRPSESQSIAEAQDRRPRLYRDLSAELAWFRTEWQADLPRRLHESASQVESEDHLGGPRMTDRFAAYIASGVVWLPHERPDGEVEMEALRLESPRGRVRHALAAMATSKSLLERVDARFLFALACRDFDVVAAGLSLTPPIMPEHVPFYAQTGIRWLRERMEGMERRREMPWQLSGQYREVT